MIDIDNSVGIVETKFFEVKDSIILESGEEFGNFTIAYETYGTLNEEKTNAIVVFHALSGNAHAAGYHSEEDTKAGWWEEMIGPNKAFDTNKYFIISSNFLGGCSGTTGPTSINPATAKPYGIDFPVITIDDMVRAQKKLIDYLGIKEIVSVAGGSMGGMQAMQWAINYPDLIKSVLVIASTSRLSAQGIAFNAVGRNAITSDKNWNNGDYYDKAYPSAGLSIARMLGHITYLCEESMHEKFGRRLQGKEKPNFNFDIDFQVESYLQYQGKSFVERFDANSYLYITKAMDYFDIHGRYGSIGKAFEPSNAKFLFIAFDSDWLFPPSQAKDIVKELLNTGKDVSYCEISSPYGHDSFLIEVEKQTKLIKSFLNDV